MTYLEAVKTCLSKYADFKGRASRSEFWWFVLFQVVVSFVLGLISYSLQGLAALALLLPGLAVGARRLHDIGKSGWLQLVGLIPLIGWLLLIYWFVQPTTPGSNEYGDGPTGPVDLKIPGAPGTPGPGEQ